MKAVRISKQSVDRCGPGPVDRFEWDDALAGFGLKVTPKGRKVFILQTRLKGRSRRFTIGVYGQPLSPDQARAEALRLLGLVASGVDPLSLRNAPDSEMTVADLWTKYLEEGCGHKKATTISVESGLAARHILKLLGTRKVHALEKPDIQKFMNDVAAGKTAVNEKTKRRGRAVVKGGKGSANRTLDLISSMMRFAIDLHLRDDNPAAGVTKFKLRTRDRYLKTDELERLGKALKEAEDRNVNPSGINAIRFLTLCGCRKSEAVGLRWKWIDFDQSLISLPDSKTGHRVIHLGTAAKKMLSDLPRREGSPFVFPSSTGLSPFGGLPKIWIAIRKAAGLEDVRLHDLRHSFASSAVSSGTSLYMVGKLLGHSQPRTTQRYSHLAPDPVRAAADAISLEISGKLNKSASND